MIEYLNSVDTSAFAFISLQYIDLRVFHIKEWKISLGCTFTIVHKLHVLRQPNPTLVHISKISYMYCYTFDSKTEYINLDD